MVLRLYALLVKQILPENTWPPFNYAPEEELQ